MFLVSSSPSVAHPTHFLLFSVLELEIFTATFPRDSIRYLRFALGTEGEGMDSVCFHHFIPAAAGNTHTTAGPFSKTSRGDFRPRK